MTPQSFKFNETLQNSRNLRNKDPHWFPNITSQYLGTSFEHFICMHYWLHVFLPVFSSFFCKKLEEIPFFHSSRKKPISSGSFWTLVKRSIKRFPPFYYPVLRFGGGGRKDIHKWSTNPTTEITSTSVLKNIQCTSYMYIQEK